MKNRKSKALTFANFVLASAVIIFCLAFFYIWYRSNSFQAALNFKLGYILIAGLLFSMITLFLRDSWKINIAIAIFSVAVSVYSIELVLFVNHSFQLSKKDGEIDKRSKLEVIEDLRAEGVDAWPAIHIAEFVGSNGLLSSNNRIFPLGGISNKTVVFCREGGPFSIYKSDENGFNNPKGLYRKGNIKIALVGDSYVHGACVQSGTDIASQLRNMGSSTINLGNFGNGPLIELAVLKEYVEPMQPEVVVWIYYEGNDLSGLYKEQTSSMLMSYLEDAYGQNLLERRDEIDTILIKYVNDEMNRQKKLLKERKQKEALKLMKLFYLRSRLGLLITINETEISERITNYKAQLPLFSDILEKANKRVSDWGGKFYFVYQAGLKRFMFNIDKEDDNYLIQYREDVLAIIHELGIPLIDFYEVLDKHPNRLSLSPFSDMSSRSTAMALHLNADGYKLLAGFIASHLRKDGLMTKKCEDKSSLHGTAYEN